MAIEIVDFPIENGGSFHSYVSLPEGKYQSFTDLSPICPFSPKHPVQLDTINGQGRFW
jgi:hypothetical protein